MGPTVPSRVWRGAGGGESPEADKHCRIHALRKNLREGRRACGVGTAFFEGPPSMRIMSTSHMHKGLS